jgi:hypothetical protein
LLFLGIFSYFTIVGFLEKPESESDIKFNSKYRDIYEITLDGKTKNPVELFVFYKYRNEKYYLDIYDYYDFINKQDEPTDDLELSNYYKVKTQLETLVTINSVILERMLQNNITLISLMKKEKDRIYLILTSFRFKFTESIFKNLLELSEGMVTGSEDNILTSLSTSDKGLFHYVEMYIKILFYLFDLKDFKFTGYETYIIDIGEKLKRKIYNLVLRLKTDPFLLILLELIINQEDIKISTGEKSKTDNRTIMEHLISFASFKARTLEGYLNTGIYYIMALSK